MYGTYALYNEHSDEARIAQSILRIYTYTLCVGTCRYHINKYKVSSYYYTYTGKTCNAFQSRNCLQIKSSGRCYVALLLYYFMKGTLLWTYFLPYLLAD